MPIDPTSSPSIISDHEWMSHVQSSPQIHEDVSKAHPGHGELSMQGHVLAASPTPSSSAHEAFLASVGEMAGGFADIEAAEREYAARMGTWLAQRQLSRSALVMGWIGGLVSPRIRRKHMERLALRREPRVSPQTEAARFTMARQEADRRIQRGAKLASAWAAQTALALLLTGRRPSHALIEAVRSHDAAIVRRDMLRHRITASAGALSQRFALEVEPPEPPAARPRLVWPTRIGCTELPARVDDPLGLAARVRADGIEWDGGDECVLELHGWEFRMPLGADGAEQLRGMLAKFGDKPALRGREDTLLFAYDVPQDVDSMRVSRMLLARREERYALTVRLRYATMLRDRTVEAAAAAATQAVAEAA